MASTRCPDCDQLVKIEPTGKPIGAWGSAQWWVIAMHPVKEEMAGSIVVWTRCDGSGKKV